MPFNTLESANAALGYLDAWNALEVPARLRALEVGFLWLTAEFVVPDTPTARELTAVKGAELAVVRRHLVRPLFDVQPQNSRGAVLREKVKVEGLEEEFQYAAPTQPAFGSEPVPEAEAWLAGVLPRREEVEPPGVMLL